MKSLDIEAQYFLIKIFQNTMRETCLAFIIEFVFLTEEFACVQQGFPEYL